MIYHCKKCGAIVNGKFRSCCGTRATTDLEDFRKALRRRRNEFMNTRAYTGRGYAIPTQAAGFAWSSAEEAVLKRYGCLLTVERFPAISDDAYLRIPEIAEKATKIYDGVMVLSASILGT